MYLKKHLKEFIISIFTFFKQGAKLLSKKYSTTLAGNVDPFYLFGGLYLIKNCKNRSKMKRYMKYVIPVIIYAVLQTLILSTFWKVSLLKVFINVAKICLCIAIMLYVLENYKKIDIFKVVKFFTYFNLIFLVIATTIGKTSFLWRLNDIVNGYSKTRLQMFFLEPSELGFHVAIVMIILLAYLLIKKDIKERMKILFYISINTICLALAKPMGAICLLALAIGVMITYWVIKNPKKRNILAYIFGILILIVLLIILIIQENPIIMRVFDTINGKDQSNNYRIGVSFETFFNSLKDYYLLGCGFGNINTQQFITRYSLATVIVNSFIYFWIEAGIFGIIYSLIIIYQLFKSCIKSKSALKWGLFAFLIIYQFVGSHFVSPINWALYGLILSDYHEKKDECSKENIYA